ncbi:unnamed protein product [Soboliphyme baturini]|uniref:Apovitellenin I n=1 Tax=Soboliphyme baturini TaxID=241478 RepID=A0A183J6D9_9BILA|nr:unnamed protein product [Soboliphyme baturini]
MKFPCNYKTKSSLICKCDYGSRHWPRVIGKTSSHFELFLSWTSMKRMKSAGEPLLVLPLTAAVLCVSAVFSLPSLSQRSSVFGERPADEERRQTLKVGAIFPDNPMSQKLYRFRVFSSELEQYNSGAKGREVTTFLPDVMYPKQILNTLCKILIQQKVRNTEGVHCQ